MIVSGQSGTKQVGQLGGLGLGAGANNAALSVDVLLNTAIAQGGQVGLAAERLMNPKKSFFQTLTNSTASALSTFVDVIQTGSYAVGGALDPTRTMREGIRDNITPGDVLLSKPGKEAGFMTKAGFQVTKFAVDTLLDPLTYLSFGTSRGILGVAKGAEVVAGANLAQKLGKVEGTRVALSKQGEDLADRYLAAQRDGLRQTFLKQERVKMVNEGVDEETITKNLIKLDEESSDYLVKTILNQDLDMNHAIKTVSKILEKHPHMAETLIDKGGIKYFGKTILSAQRVNDVISVIPGMTILDRVVAPVRGKLGNMFSTKYSAGMRVPDELLDIEQKYKMLQQSKESQLLQNGDKLKQKLSLTNQEWEFVTAAVEAGLKPRDPRAADVWMLLHKEAPENGTINPNIWKGVLGVEKMVSGARKDLVGAGFKIKDMDGYMPHLLVKEDISTIPFKSSGTKQNTDRIRFASISTLVDDEGVRTPVKILSTPNAMGDVKIQKVIDGKLVEDTVKFTDVSGELSKLSKITERRVNELTAGIKVITDKIAKDKSLLKEGIATKAVDDVAKFLDDVPDLLPEDRKILAESIAKIVEDTDLEKIVSKRLERFYKDGVKLSNGQTISSIDIDKLVTELVMAKKEATFVASRINKLLTKGVNLPNQSIKLPSGKKVDTEILKLANKLKKEALEIRKTTIDRKLDKDLVTDLLKQVVARTSKNPKGLSSIIDSLVANKQVAADIKAELSDVNRAYRIEADYLESIRGKYVGADGKISERTRASMIEAKKLGVDFEDNALVVALSNSSDAINVATSRHMIKEIAEKFGSRESESKQGYVFIDKLGLEFEREDLAKYLTTRDGERLMFHPAVAEKIKNFTTGISNDAGTNDFFRAYDGLQNYFKAAVTALFPAFHGRNALSNVFLMFNKIGYESLNPAMHVATANLVGMERKTRKLTDRMFKDPEAIKEYSQLMTKVVFTDRTGYKWSWGEMRKELMDNVVAFQPNNLGQMDQFKVGKNSIKDVRQRLFPESAMGKLGQKIKPVNPFDTDSVPFKAGFMVGQGIEDYSRTLAFLSQLKGSGDPMQAARVTKLALFDYSNLTSFEKNVLRRLIPFYSFSRKNLELQVETLLTTPGRIAQQIRGVQTLGDAFAGEELTEKELAALPEWAKGGYNLVRSREGSSINLLKTLGTPLEELFSRGDADANIGIISPLAKAPLELMSGYSFFYGKPISEVTQADAYKYAPDFIKDFIGYEEVTYTSKDGSKGVYNTSFRPDRMFLINNMQPVGRFFSEVNRIEKSPDPIAKLNALFFGFGERTFDIELEEEKRLKENQKALEKILQQGGIGYTFSRYVPPTDATDDEIGM